MRLFDTDRVGQLQGALCVLAALFMVLGAPSEAFANARRASMVIDANTGQTLHASQADELRHPASLTKMMTLYLVFEEIEQGRLSLDSKIPMTKWGAMAPPSKLGLKEGEEITVRDAIRALVTKSANDIARALAERIGGTEVGFARLMTEKARLIGMSKTTFRNASGLPDVEQVTTARDMLTLALHLHDSFPQHYHFFATRAFTHRGRTYRNHNGLLRTYPGMDGMKTGYIRMSGFNVVSSVRRGGRHVVAVVFGGTTATSRNAEMRALLNRTIGKASTRKTRKPTAVSFYRATPPKPAARPAPSNPTADAAATRPLVTASTAPTRPPRPTEAASAAQPRPAAANISIAKVRPVSVAAAAAGQPDRSIPPHSADAPARAGTAASAAPGRAPSTLQEQADELARGRPVLARLSFTDQAALARPAPAPAVAQPLPALARELPAATPQAPPLSSPAGDGGYHVQVGAYGSAAEAQKALIAALEQASGLLAEAAPVTVPVKSGARQLYRARFAGLDSSQARNACQELRRRQIDCFVAKAD